MNGAAADFQEIAHSGGKITFEIRMNEEGQTSYQTTFSGSRPNAMAVIGAYALPPGIPVGRYNLAGPFIPPPCDGCLSVVIASDSQGKFGHDCKACKGYWRSGPWPNQCPYCGIQAESHRFLTRVQLKYVRHYCEVLLTALESGHGTVTIDMDAVADAAGKEGEKPMFYVSDQSQQHKFTCPECDEFNDIIGRFGYCSRCGTRNDLAIYKGQTNPTLRDRLNSGAPPEDCVKDAVSSFDTFVGQYAKQIAEYMPMTNRRKARITKQRFHNHGEIRQIFTDWFDIDICEGMKDDECRFVAKMFYRRHVYEHNGGEVDQKYLTDSGDATVKLKQHIHENKEDAHSPLGSLLKMAENLHSGFHELFPPLEGPIREFREMKEWKARL